MTKRKRTEIECILCKNAIKLPEYVSQDYSGDLLCDRCSSLFYIKLDKWEVKQFKVKTDRLEKWRSWEKLMNLQETAAKLKAKPEKSSEAGCE